MKPKDKAYLLFFDCLVRSVMDAKFKLVKLGRPVASTDPVEARQIASALVVVAARRIPVDRMGQPVSEG